MPKSPGQSAPLTAPRVPDTSVRLPPCPHTSSFRKPVPSARRTPGTRPRAKAMLRTSKTAKHNHQVGAVCQGTMTGTPRGAADPTGCGEGISALKNRQRERGSRQDRRPVGRQQGALRVEDRRGGASRGARGGGRGFSRNHLSDRFWKGSVEQDLGQLSRQASDPPGGGLLRPQ